MNCKQGGKKTQKKWVIGFNFDTKDTVALFFIACSILAMPPEDNF